MDLNTAIAEAVERVLQEKLAGWPAQEQDADISRQVVAVARLQEVVAGLPARTLLRVKDMAVMANLSERTIRELIDRGEIPTRDVEPYNVILVARPDFETWLESLPRRRGTGEQKTA